MSDEPEHNFNIHMPETKMAGAYANFANISHSETEFTITFSYLDHGSSHSPAGKNVVETPGVVVSRVHVAPSVMKSLLEATQDNYSKWETAQGIRSLPETPNRD
jgi:hypothetical protein